MSDRHSQLGTRAWRAPGAIPSMAILGALTAAFVVLATAVAAHQGPFVLDVRAASGLGARRGTSAFRLGQAVSIVGSGPAVALLAVAIGIGVFWRTRQLYISAAVPAAAGGAGLVELAVKHIVGRPRPPTALLTGKSGFGFPSGHTSGFTALATAIIAVVFVLTSGRRRALVTAVVCAVLAMAVGVSRVVVGAHWATDVIGGFILGTATGVAAVSLASIGAVIAPQINGRFAREVGTDRGFHQGWG